MLWRMLPGQMGGRAAQDCAESLSDSPFIFSLLPSSLSSSRFYDMIMRRLADKFPPDKFPPDNFPPDKCPCGQVPFWTNSPRTSSPLDKFPPDKFPWKASI